MYDGKMEAIVFNMNVSLVYTFINIRYKESILVHIIFDQQEVHHECLIMYFNTVVSFYTLKWHPIYQTGDVKCSNTCPCIVVCCLTYIVYIHTAIWLERYHVLLFHYKYKHVQCIVDHIYIYYHCIHWEWNVIWPI